jgi:hypothetical protein
LFEKSGFGTGNFISAIYALRMAARVLESVQAVEFLCSDAHDEAAQLILPWLTGAFPSCRFAAAVHHHHHHITTSRQLWNKLVGHTTTFRLDMH